MRFSKVNIEISNLCNFKCSFCPTVSRPKELMGLPLFERIIAQVSPLTDQVCFHLLGEPLLHPNLPEMLEICARFKTPVFFVSNGALLTDARARLLLHPIIRQMNFSLHSFKNNRPDEDPTEYLERIFAFTETALKERPELYLNFRLWNLEDPELTTLPANVEMRERIEKRFDFKFPSAVDVRTKKSFRVKNRLYLHFDTEFQWPDLTRPSLGEHGTCYGLRSHFGILVDGTVVPCCLDHEGRIPLGQISETPIEEILARPKARALVEGFLARKLVDPLCQRCGYVTRFSARTTFGNEEPTSPIRSPFSST